MKKIIFLIMTMLVFTSCLTKVNVDNKGDLNLSIKWPESSDSKSVSKALLSGTDKVEIYLFHPATHTSINRTLTHADGQTHNEEFKDLPEGVWDININTYTGSTLNANYFDFITISNDKPTYVTHKFGSPLPVTRVLDGIINFGTMNWNFIGDGKEITDTQTYYIGFIPKSSYNVSGYTPTTEYDDITVKFIISKDPKFEKDFVQFEDTQPPYSIVNYYTTTALYQDFGYGENYAKVTLTIGTGAAGSELTQYNLTNNTTYYWKAILSNVGTTPTIVESNVFTFKTNMP